MNDKGGNMNDKEKLMNNIIKMYDEFAKTPCGNCSMIASLHAHTPEQAKNFRFGCEAEELNICRQKHLERRRALIGK